MDPKLRNADLEEAVLDSFRGQ